MRENVRRALGPSRSGCGSEGFALTHLCGFDLSEKGLGYENPHRFIFRFACRSQANSPYGTLVVEDYQVKGMKCFIPSNLRHMRVPNDCRESTQKQVNGGTGMQQKVGETPLQYQLKARLPRFHTFQCYPVFIMFVRVQ